MRRTVFDWTLYIFMQNRAMLEIFTVRVRCELSQSEESQKHQRATLGSRNDRLTHPIRFFSVRHGLTPIFKHSDQRYQSLEDEER